MKTTVEIFTHVTGRTADRGYRVSVFVNGVFQYDRAATPGQVVKVRNTEAESWADRADKVTAHEIPAIAGLTVDGRMVRHEG